MTKVSKFTIELTMLGVLIILIVLIFYIRRRNKKKKLNKYTEEILACDAKIVNFKNNLSHGLYARNKIIRGYIKILMHIHDMYIGEMQCARLFRDKIILAACRRQQKTHIIEIFCFIIEFLSSDIQIYTDGESKTKAENEFKQMRHMLTEINQSIMQDKPYLSLEIYSKYFEKLLDICQLINEGVKRVNSENVNVKNTAWIDDIIQKYRPKSIFYKDANSNNAAILQKINSRYQGKIKKLEKIERIWDYTNFIVFDEILLFSRKFYKQMDIIEGLNQSTRSQSESTRADESKLRNEEEMKKIYENVKAAFDSMSERSVK